MKVTRGQFTLPEILGQPLAWEASLQEALNQTQRMQDFLRHEEWSDVVFCGCGSTYYLALAAATIFRTVVDIRTWAFPSSELLLFPRANLVGPGPYLLIALSRSGETTETLRAAQIFQAGFGKNTVAITCDETSTLAAICTTKLVAQQAKEKGVAQTRSFTSMLLLTQFCAGIASGRSQFVQELSRLPDVGKSIISKGQPLARRLGYDRTINSFFFLGSGPLYGLACETMLKMKEVSLSHAEAFHFMEFRHGPKSLVDDRTLIVALVSETATSYETAVLTEMQALGARTLILADKAIGVPTDYEVVFESGLAELAYAVLYLPIPQLMAYYRALAKGLDPDQPRNLEAVVRL